MEKIVVLDFGGQYSHLIAKRVRNLGYYSEIALPAVKIDTLKDVKGIILSGGPSSVYDKDIPEFNNEILDLDIPILGLCYGHHLLSKESGGEVCKAKIGEYGYTVLQKVKNSPLFDNIILPSQVWMSHADEVTVLPPGFEAIGQTADCTYAAVQNLDKKRFGLQCHIEVKDTPIGDAILKNFINLCDMQINWDRTKVYERIIEQIKAEAKNKKILLFLSGGVDSTVAFALLNKALGQDRVLGLHIDNGFMRMNESSVITERYKKFGFTNFIVEDASTIFLDAVKNLTDPQEKRKNIGETFITVRDNVVNRLNLVEGDWLLAQGTLYPDIIESGGTKHSNVIKTHHNRVDGIQKLIQKGLIIEPLKDLYKDEVRLLGKTLGLSDELVFRHPFPGPGISINVLCSTGIDADTDKLKTINENLSKLNLTQYSDKIKKVYAIPVKSVGVQGDFRTYCSPAVLDFGDFMANPTDWDSLEQISSYITNNTNDINRTILKIYDKSNLGLIKAFCTKDRLDMIRAVDKIVLDTLKEHNWYRTVFQHLTVCLPYATTESKCSIVLRPVVSEDVMTARFAKLPMVILNEIVDKIRSLDFIDALYYDITNKPPATFGWE